MNDGIHQPYYIFMVRIGGYGDTPEEAFKDACANVDSDALEMPDTFEAESANIGFVPCYVCRNMIDPGTAHLTLCGEFVHEGTCLDQHDSCCTHLNCQ